MGTCSGFTTRPEELRVHHRTTILAEDARAVVVTVLASGRVPPLQATLFDTEYPAARPVLQRFLGHGLSSQRDGLPDPLHQ